MKYSPTWINDEFDLNKLDCQYSDICKFYSPENGKCKYGEYCDIRVEVGNIEIPVREILKSCLENYVTIENLKVQIKEIVDEK